MAPPIEELRELLHRAVDLLCDELSRRRAPAPSNTVHDATELDVAYAARVLRAAAGRR
jgi:hypothetical protein